MSINGKAVEEVWAWRDALEKELEKIPESERVDYINQKAREGCQKLGINCRFVKRASHSPQRKAA